MQASPTNRVVTDSLYINQTGAPQPNPLKVDATWSTPELGLELEDAIGPGLRVFLRVAGCGLRVASCQFVDCLAGSLVVELPSPSHCDSAKLRNKRYGARLQGIAIARPRSARVLLFARTAAPRRERGTASNSRPLDPTCFIMSDNDQQPTLS